MTDQDPWALPLSASGAVRRDPAVPLWTPDPELPAPDPRPPRAGPALPVLLAVAVLVVAVLGGSAWYLLDTHDDDPGRDRATATDDGAPRPPRVLGRGYSYELPDGWNDGSDRLERAGDESLIDTLSGAVDAGGVPTSLIVEAGPALGTSIEELRDHWVRNASQAHGTTPLGLPPVEIGGVRAVGVTFQDQPNEHDVPMDQIGYLVIHEGRGYALAFTFPTHDRSGEATLREIVESWRWGP